MLNLGEPRDYLRLFFLLSSVYLGLRFDALLSTVAVEEEKESVWFRIEPSPICKSGERERKRNRARLWFVSLDLYVLFSRRNIVLNHGDDDDDQGDDDDCYGDDRDDDDRCFQSPRLITSFFIVLQK